MELTYSEIENILDMKHIDASATGYTVPPGVYKVNTIHSRLKSLLHDEVKVNITTEDFRLRSNLTTNKTIRFTKKSYTLLSFTQSHSGPIGDIQEFFQLIPGKDKSNRPINFTGVDKNHLKCNCIDGSIVKGVREPILYSFAHSSPPSHII